MKKKWKADMKGLTSLEYIVFKNVPMKESEHGPIIDLPPRTLDRLAAAAVIQQRIPLRGKEVKFLRKSLGLSLEKFAGQLDLTSGSVFKWEKDAEVRLHPVNEIAVRTLVAEALGISMSGHFSDLVGTKKRPDEVVLKAS